MTRPRGQREQVRPYFAGVVIEGTPDGGSLADAQRLVVERLARHVSRDLQSPASPPSRGEAAD